MVCALETISRPRIVPVLLIEGRRAIKTTQFSSPIYLGDPVNTVRIFSEKCADELMVLNVSMKREIPNIDFPLLERIAEEAFMPMSFGGSITTIDEVDRIISLGIEKVVIGWSSGERRKLIEMISAKYGAQAVSVCIDYADSKEAQKNLKKRSRSFESSSSLSEVIRQCDEVGVGEIILQNVDLDGSMSGMRLDVLRLCCQLTTRPVVSLGGAGSLNDLGAGILAGASATAAGSMFVFQDKQRSVLINYPSEKELDVFSEALQGGI